ncbi:MAG: glycerophosphodiester phosphodiesterase [Hungatella sp.]|jgi:glycerophosphoryl diester phosphodiesterase|nr:glycerophosphodiester phosphodiesterase [Hungatella sp.]
MKTLVKETYQIMGLNFRNLILFELVYRAVTGTIFYQLVNIGLKFSLKMSGYSYLTLGNAGYFFLKPWSLLTFLLLALLGLMLILLEIGGLITLYSGAAYSLCLPLGEIFLGAAGKLADELKAGNFRLFVLGLANYILVNLYYLYRTLSHVKPLNFVMKELWASPLTRLGLLLVLVGLAALVIPSVFSFHGCMIEQKSYRDSQRRSQELLKGRLFPTLFRQVSYQIVMAGAFILTYLGCMAVIALGVAFLVRQDMKLALLLQIADHMEWAFLLVAGAMAMAVHIALVTVEYYQYESLKKHPGQGWDFFYTKRPLINRNSVLAFVTALGLVGGLCLFETVYNGNSIDKSITVQTGITAHRGGSLTAPENTMAAMEAAVEQMADRAEIDVQETADGIVVLFHDGTLKRQTGLSKKVSDLTLKELQALDVGSWFSPEFAGEKIPTLEQVMEFAKGKIDLNIEIKNMGNNSYLPDKVLDLVVKYEMQDQCIITSTNRNYLEKIKKMDPDVRTGYVIAAAYGDYYSDEFIDVISIRSSFVTGKMVEAAHEAGKAVHAWTVNDRAELERLSALGVDGVITDRPVLAREVLYGEESARGVAEYLLLILR